MRLLTISVLVASALLFASQASAGHFKIGHCTKAQPAKTEKACAQRNLYHAQFTLEWIKAERNRSLLVVPASPTKLLRLHRHQRDMRWLYGVSRQRLTEARLRITPPHPALDSCTATILSREGGMNPEKWNGGAVAVWKDDGNTHGGSGAYGGPQALPGSKMASAGPDWATNIWTQIKWMIGYETSKYGSPCGALAHWNEHQSY